jgi:hypothetical protein
VERATVSWYGFSDLSEEDIDTEDFNFDLTSPERGSCLGSFILVIKAKMTYIHIHISIYILIYISSKTKRMSKWIGKRTSQSSCPF